MSDERKITFSSHTFPAGMRVAIDDVTHVIVSYDGDEATVRSVEDPKAKTRRETLAKALGLEASR